MQRSGRTSVCPSEVAEILGVPVERLSHPVGKPKAMYSSFRRRRLAARHRVSMRLPGPRRTAESYVLEALLRSGAEVAKGTVVETLLADGRLVSEVTEAEEGQEARRADTDAAGDGA